MKFLHIHLHIRPREDSRINIYDIKSCHYLQICTQGRHIFHGGTKSIKKIIKYLCPNQFGLPIFYVYYTKMASRDNRTPIFYYTVPHNSQNNLAGFSSFYGIGRSD